MITGILQDMGAGKTLTMTALGYFAFIKTSADICANYHLNYDAKKIKELNLKPFKYIYLANPLELDKFYSQKGGGLALLDELWLWADSRLSRSKMNIFISKLMRFSRKRGYDIFYTAQTLDTLDKRIRNLTSAFIFPEKLKNDVFKLNFFDENLKKKPTRFINGKIIYPLFNTREEVGDYQLL